MPAHDFICIVVLLLRNWGYRLRYKDEFPVLLEMLVKGKDGVNAQRLHDDKTCCVGVRKLLI